MALALSSQYIFKNFLRVPYKKLFFVTIRDNAKKKFITIDQVKTWCRRYSENYFIVRGLEGGIHFHVLIEHQLTNGRKMVPVKGIHFHIQAVKSGFISNYSGPVPCVEQSEYSYTKFLKKIDFLSRYGCQTPSVCLKLCSMIMNYHTENELKRIRRIKSRESARRSLSRKGEHLTRLNNYLMKNYYENSETDFEYDKFYPSKCLLSDLLETHV